MRPPNKSRSRNKNNRRNNNPGNALNRVYDSAGPQGRVRGTPAQVIEKYQSLAHDSSLAGDRVAMENFQQHAEHYIRLINEAQRQNAERREAQEAAQAAANEARQNNNGGGQQRDANAGDPGKAPQPDAPQSNGAMETVADGDSGGLVETPESQAKPARENGQRRSRPPRKPAEPAPEEAKPAE